MRADPAQARHSGETLRAANSAGKPIWPADHVERWPTERLIPFARNARTHSEAQVSQIASSIREWGWTNPVLVAEDGTIIAGHGRVLAARKLGILDVPVMVAAGWTEAQKRAYTIADNKLTLNGGWDEELLGLELGELEVLGFDVGLIGFTEAEREALAARLTEGLTDPDAVPDLPSEPVARLGDLWILGRHRLRCGDSTCRGDVSMVLAGISPHLMVTDPPYGVNYDPAWRKRAGVNLNERKLGKVANDDRADWREAWALFPGSVAYVWHAGRHTSEVQQSLEASGFDIRSQIIWAKDRFALSRGHYHWQHEPCWYAVRGTAAANWSGDRKQSTLWTINAREDDGHGHGTQKPVECMRRPIENNSSPGQVVYEPFSGSGTTIIAAEMTGRCCFAIRLCRCCGAAMAGLHRRDRDAGRHRQIVYGSGSQPAGRRRRLMGRRAHRPDPSQRRQVEALAAYGIPEADISGVVGIDPKTLRKYYREELDLGETKANAQVAGFLFNSARNGNVTAQIFWLKTRAKWRETPTELRHSGAIARKDVSELSDEELMDMIYSVGNQIGLVAKTVGSNVTPFSLIERK